MNAIDKEAMARASAMAMAIAMALVTAIGKKRRGE